MTGSRTLRLATTTSTYDTGLLDVLNETFQSTYSVTMEVIGQGTGAALETARNGDADLVLAHARSLEDAFLKEEYGINRRDVMANDFVIVGPSGDPANVAAQDNAMEAFSAIASTKATFLSRGDQSGTHERERSIWKEAGIEPAGEWYRALGSGMGEVLTHANLVSGYTLTDRGTFLHLRENLDLDIVFEASSRDTPSRLWNPYGIIAVNPRLHSHVSYELAMLYIGFLTSKPGQTIIGEFQVDDEPLFAPIASNTKPAFDQYVPAAWRCNG